MRPEVLFHLPHIIVSIGDRDVARCQLLRSVSCFQTMIRLHIPGYLELS